MKEIGTVGGIVLILVGISSSQLYVYIESSALIGTCEEQDNSATNISTMYGSKDE